VLEARVEEDPLTGLLNRRGFARAYARALAYVRRYGATAALLFLDLDGFKRVNDRHGHAVGDAVLRRLGRLLAKHVRAADVVARVGGDEFAILLWNLSQADAQRRARGLEALVAATRFSASRVPVRIGASIGVTMLAPDDRLAAALARADRAMYRRKREKQ
jgi:diguanylate cyclase (GGDEF)-like protein